MTLTWHQLGREVDKCVAERHSGARQTYGDFCTLGPQSNRIGWTKDDYVVEILNSRQPTHYGVTCVLDAGLCAKHAAMWEEAFPSKPERGAI